MWLNFCFIKLMKRKPAPRKRWDQKQGLKGITVYLEPADKQLLKKLARDADKSVALYLRRLVEAHIRAYKPPSND